MSTATLDIAPPSLRHFVAEAGAVFDRLAGGVSASRIGRAHRAKLAGGAPVMIIPGLLANDFMTRVLQRAIRAAGRPVTGWGAGRNRGVQGDLLDLLVTRIEAFSPDRPVVLVGWSLGGLVARELAKHAPDRVERVVTLGSPFSGSLRANRAWKLYERVAGHAIDEHPLVLQLSVKPPVPTIALWSPRDGIVAASSARGRDGEIDLSVEVDCRHMSFVSAPAAIEAVLTALAVKLP